MGLIEPFKDRQQVEEYKRRLGLKHAVVNMDGKIWAFSDKVMEYVVIRDEEQMLTMSLHNQELGIEVMVSLVYAKCMQRERLQLWESIDDLENTTDKPWLIGRDFNVLLMMRRNLGVVQSQKQKEGTSTIV